MTIAPNAISDTINPRALLLFDEMAMSIISTIRRLKIANPEINELSSFLISFHLLRAFKYAAV